MQIRVMVEVKLPEWDGDTFEEAKQLGYESDTSFSGRTTRDSRWLIRGWIDGERISQLQKIKGVFAVSLADVKLEPFLRH